VRFRGVTERAGQFGVAHGINPDLVTIAGLALIAVAAVFIGMGQFGAGALIILLAAPLDVWDGAIARALHRKNRFGALLDSSLDRFADGFLMLGLMVYFSSRGDQGLMLVAGLALIGAFGVSYVRARAEGLQIPCKDGVFSRTERMIVQIVMFLTGWVVPGVILLAIGNNLTAIQRILVVYRATRADEESGAP
jgi:CDP-diacylglycerol--glycerol-3-phosphate 3-phosphatidyltransferase